jgi:uncharacterized protein (TIGR02996 family)
MLARAIAAPTASATLAALLDAWSASPHPALAELVDIAGRRAADEREPRVEPAALAQRHQQWLAVAALRDPVDLDWLLPRMTTSRGELMRERLLALVEFGPDPRIAAALVAVCAEQPLTSQQHRPVWTQIFRVLNARLDVRIAPQIAALAKRTPVTSFDYYFVAKIRLIERALATAESPEPPPADELAALEAKLEIAKLRVVAKTADDFLRDIWAAPADDGPREVFADWLLHRDDPRGELITLQIGRAQGRSTPTGLKRERTLLAEHGRTWMGELEPVVGFTGYAFDRGFLYRCEPRWRRLAAQPELMTHPAWATVREYRLASDGERSCDRWLDHMIALGAKRV